MDGLDISKLLPDAPSSGPIIVSGDSWQKIKQVAELLQLRFDPKMFEVVAEGSGRKVSLRIGEEFLKAAVGESCTDLKLSLTKEDEKYILNVSSGMVNNTPLSYSDEVTKATKVWIVVDAEVGVVVNEKINDSTGDSTISYEYDGSVIYSNYRILLQEDDPTSIPITQPTSANNVDMVFAMLAGEILSEVVEGETVLSLGATRCGHRTIKWCPPLSVYFLPI